MSTTKFVAVVLQSSFATGSENNASYSRGDTINLPEWEAKNFVKKGLARWPDDKSLDPDLANAQTQLTGKQAEVENALKRAEAAEKRLAEVQTAHDTLAAEAKTNAKALKNATDRATQAEAERDSANERATTAEALLNEATDTEGNSGGQTPEANTQTKPAETTPQPSGNNPLKAKPQGKRK